MAKTKKPRKARFAAENFLVLTYGLGLALAGLAYWLEINLHSMLGFVLSTLYIFLPAGVVLVIYNQRILEFLDLALHPNRWMLVSLLFPLALAALSFYATLQFTPTELSWGMEDMLSRMAAAHPNQPPPSLPGEGLHPFWQAVIQSLIFGCTLNAFFGMGEELGWRGLLLREWLPLGFWQANLRIGLAWGLWLVPLELLGRNYPEQPAWGAALTVAWCVLLSPLIAFVRLQAKSVAAAALFRGMLLAFAGTSTLLIQGGGELTSGLLGWPSLLVFLLFDLSLVLYLANFPLERETNPVKY